MLFIVQARGRRRSLSDRVRAKETREYAPEPRENTGLHLFANDRLPTIYEIATRPFLMPLIGYARVSTEDQTLLP